MADGRLLFGYKIYFVNATYIHTYICIYTYVFICDKTEYKITVEGSCNIQLGMSPEPSNTPISKGMIRSPWPRSCSGPDPNSQPAKC